VAGKVRRSVGPRPEYSLAGPSFTTISLSIVTMGVVEPDTWEVEEEREVEVEGEVGGAFHL